MRVLDYETDRPLKQVGILLTPEEARQLLSELQRVLDHSTGYARVVDPDWGDVDISLYTAENSEFLHQRVRRLIETGE